MDVNSVDFHARGIKLFKLLRHHPETGVGTARIVLETIGRRKTGIDSQPYAEPLLHGSFPEPGKLSERIENDMRTRFAEFINLIFGVRRSVDMHRFSEKTSEFRLKKPRCRHAFDKRL